MRLTTIFALSAALLLVGAGAFTIAGTGKNALPLPHYGPVVAQNLMVLQPAAFAPPAALFAAMGQAIRGPGWLIALPAAGTAACVQQITVIEKPGQAPQIRQRQTGNCGLVAPQAAPPAKAEARAPI